jgi:hypothetical protein
MQAAAAVQATLSRELLCVPGSGAGSMDQLVPFHDSARMLGPLDRKPTAVHAAAEVQDTLVNPPW